MFSVSQWMLLIEREGAATVNLTVWIPLASKQGIQLLLLCPGDLLMRKHSYTNLFRQVEQVVFEEHVFGLAPSAIYDDHIVLHSAYFLVLHQLLQVLGLGAWIKD